MRRITFGAVLALAATLFIGSVAGADYYDYELDGDAAPAIGVEYTIGSGAGELTILGGAGMSVEAYDAAGMPIAGTVVFDNVSTVAVPITTDSGTVFVRVGEDWYACSADPDWSID